MRLPRDVSGERLAKALGTFGWRETRRTGSHIRLTLDDPPQHHPTIPAHDALNAGTLAAILSMAAQCLQIGPDEPIGRLKL